MAFLARPRQKAAPAPTDRADLFVGAEQGREPNHTTNDGRRVPAAAGGQVTDPRPRDEEVTARETMTVPMGTTRPEETAETWHQQAGNVHANVLRPPSGAYVAPQDAAPVPLSGWARIRRNPPVQSWDAGAEQSQDWGE